MKSEQKKVSLVDSVLNKEEYGNANFEEFAIIYMLLLFELFNCVS